MTRSELRRALRDRRGALGAAGRARLSRSISREVLKAIGPATRGRRIAGYSALDEEVDISAAIATLVRRGALLYLPRIESYRRRQLAFASTAFTGTAGELRPNRFGIPEPAPGARRIRTQQLDVVLMPLVGFDTRGARLGDFGSHAPAAPPHRHRIRLPAGRSIAGRGA
jgi:5-formyltetrahydrofolate cyclo-ligase